MNQRTTQGITSRTNATSAAEEFQSVSVAQAIEEYRYAISQKSERTQEQYLAVLDEFCLWCLEEGLSLGDIHVATIRKYTQHLKERGNKIHTGGELSTTSVRTYLRAIKVFLRWCSREDGLEDVVSEKTASRITLPSAEKKVMEIFSPDELAALLSATMRNPTDELQVRDYAILSILIDTGIRAGELVGLTLDRVHTQPGNGSYIHVNGKTGEREVGLGIQATRALHRYISRYRDHYQTERHVFLTRQHTPLTRNTLYEICERLGEWAGIQGDKNPHKYRHTAACRSIEAGMGIYDVQLLLGHSNISTTTGYLTAHGSRQARQHAISVLDGLNGKGGTR